MNREGNHGGRCVRCGGKVMFQGIVSLEEGSDDGFQVLSSFGCRFCGHSFVDLIDRRLAIILESQWPAAA